MDHGTNGYGQDHNEAPASASDPITLPHSTSSSPPTVRKRVLSGGLFSRFSFLRPAEISNDDWLQKGDAPRSKTSIDDEDGSELRSGLTSSTKPHDNAGGQLALKQRKRKGSLRKSALLGVRRSGSDGRERKNSPLQRGTTQAKHEGTAAEKHPIGAQSGGFGLSGASTYSQSPASGDGKLSAAKLSMLTTMQGDADSKNKVETSSATLSSPSDSKNPQDYTSTTEEDDDILSFSRQPIVPNLALLPPSEANTTSYFPSQVPRMRTRSARRLHPSPLQNAHAPAPEPYSYTETEYWGWVILFVTWLLFTVGMGSCLDIWSWAWDVGETPYAPPELEDDPTLPIVGYYPALIVLTGVVAWVWITVAWVGMKYFRHAKIEDIR